MMHYYQHHIGDFIKATARLSDNQTMAYLRLLWMYYDRERPLKPDSKVLSFQIGASLEDTELLLESYFVLCDDGWHQKRCDKEIGEYRALLDKKSNAGRASAEQRKNRRSTDVEQVLSSSGTDVQLTNNHKPKTNNQQPINTPDGVSQSVWQEFVNHRKSKKAQVTQLVIDGIQKEADKAGFSLEDALKEVVVRNWQGFKAEWVLPKPTFGDMARVSVAPTQGRDPALIKLDEDKKRTGPPPPEILARINEVMKGKVS